MKQGDLVTRKSYGGDIIFRIEAMNRYKTWLKGINYRLLADSPWEDLELVDSARFYQQEETFQRSADESVRRFDAQYKQMQKKNSTRGAHNKARHARSYFELPGKVLHMDGDLRYLKKSMQLYKQLRVPAEGVHVHESAMPSALYKLLPQTQPDIVVITGHDGLVKSEGNPDVMNLNNYKNSQNFVKAVKIARQYERNRDSLVVVAGACQSHYEALLLAGANFASSPSRILIHALDPLIVAARVSFTSIKDTIHIGDIIHQTQSGLEGLGGVETRGSFRLGLPDLKSNYEA
ncbi:sporulation peptidase YabG [Paenibacillus sp. J2TS4]|uniref:sporulation peptidase YabG n=1 Tax=Paenibacillus sp. J2TS4 TaxID=2807194 RepID=UPI001B29C4FD|nr:sporulation peptidase YabG [Paenibacillus sp. J2TS4]GIP36325.1 sporulation peptidase YabG [Paenibacillus sp. J2TS4]